MAEQAAAELPTHTEEENHEHRSESYVERESGVKLFTVKHGKHTSTHKVLFIMGLATSHKSWDPQVNHFKQHPDDFEVVVFDNRGVGWSSSPPGPYSMDMMADDALAIATHYNWEAFNLVGVSMGGMISQHVLLKAPERIKTLSLIATRMEGGFWNRLPPINGMWGLAKSKLCRTAEGQVNALLETLFPIAWLELPAVSSSSSVAATALQENPNITNREWMFKLMLQRRLTIPQPTMAAVSAQLSAINGHGLQPDQIETIKKLPLKKLLITGDIDYLVAHNHSLRMKDLINAELILLNGVGHGVCEQEAHTVNEALHKQFTE